MAISIKKPLSFISRQHLIFIIFLFLLFLKILYMAPIAEIGGDAAIKWDISRAISSANFSLFNDGPTINHHYMRWGSWLSSVLLISTFSDQTVFYFLATVVPSAMAGLVFLYIILTCCGTIAGLIFCLLWFLDIEIYRATFQLLPTGAALLPLSLLILTIGLYCKRALGETTSILFIFLTTFWLYGVKETNLFFVPGVALIILYQSRLRGVFFFMSLWLAGYAVETGAFRYISDEMSPFGRIFELFDRSAPHIDTMLQSNHMISEQEALLDAGIISRWYRVELEHIPVYFISIVIFFRYGLKKIFGNKISETDSFVGALAIVSISFVIFTSFFFISLDPVRLGQPIRSRYVAVLLPLSYFVILYQFKNHLHVLFKWKLLVAISTILIAAVIFDYVAFRGSYLIEKVNNRWNATLSQASIYDRSMCYNQLGKRFDKANCAIAVENKHLITNLTIFIPLESRSSELDLLLSTKIIRNGINFVVKTKPQCTAPIILTNDKHSCMK